MNKQAPTNPRDWTAADTVEAVREQSRQFTQQEAGYSQTGGGESERCEICYFWQGGGQCQVVGGEIVAGGLSELYINKEEQDAAMDEEEMGKRTNDKRETKSFSVGECKVLDEDQGIVEHLVAVMGNVDLGDDVIHQGAFTKTIAERGRKVKVVDSHNYGSAMDVIGKPLHIWEVDRSELPLEILSKFPTATGGLMAKTQFLMDTEMGSEIFKRIKAGAIDQYSIGYDALDMDFSKNVIDGQERTVRNLRTIKLYEYSPVVFAMNEATATLNAKGKDEISNKLLAERYRVFVEKHDIPPETGGELQEAIMFYLQFGDKAGRMLSTANANQLASAVVTLVEVLERAGIDVPGFARAAADEDEEKVAKSEPLTADIAPPIINNHITINAADGDIPNFKEIFESLDNVEYEKPVDWVKEFLKRFPAPSNIPAPDNQVADNEHQAGPQLAPTSDEDVLTQIKMLELELNFMEV